MIVFTNTRLTDSYFSTTDRTSPFDSRVIKCSPGFSEEASVTAFPSFIVILYPRLKSLSGEASAIRCCKVPTGEIDGTNAFVTCDKSFFCCQQRKTGVRKFAMNKIGNTGLKGFQPPSFQIKKHINSLLNPHR